MNQYDIDKIIGLRLDEIIEIRRELERIDRKRSDLNDLGEMHVNGEPINICLRNNEGHILFSFWTVPAEGHCQLAEEVIQSCTAHLMRKRVALFTPSPEPVQSGQPASTPVQPVTTGGKWYATEALALALDVHPTYLGKFTQSRGIQRRKIGHRAEYFVADLAALKASKNKRTP